jgi:hypothetical protein
LCELHSCDASPKANVIVWCVARRVNVNVFAQVCNGLSGAGFIKLKT